VSPPVADLHSLAVRALLLLLAALLPGCVATGDAGAGRWYRHFLAVLEAPPGLGTRVVRAPFPCGELVASWNLDAPPGKAVVLELSVARGEGEWSPWLLVGSWGLDADEAEALRGELPRRSMCSMGRVDVDTFVASRPIDRARLRARPLHGSGAGVVLRRAAFCFTASSGGDPPGEPVPASVALQLDVPFRSQRREDPALASRVCSPTSLAMVLAFHGLRHATAQVAARARDPLHGIYGNWSRAVQVAYSFGLPGYVTRFADWGDVRRALADGTPLIASVRAGAGQLGGAPFEETEGHLIVIRGLDAGGDVLVCDPAAATESAGRTHYARADLERVWFQNRKGTAYVLGPTARAGR